MSLESRIAAFISALGADIKTLIAHLGSGGTAHSSASTTTAGFMSPADKARLDSLSEGGGGVVLPLVTGEIVVGQPIFVILDDGSLVYSGVA